VALTFNLQVQVLEYWPGGVDAVEDRRAWRRSGAELGEAGDAVATGRWLTEPYTDRSSSPRRRWRCYRLCHRSLPHLTASRPAASCSVKSSHVFYHSFSK